MKGFNYRMAGIQGAVLRVKLRHLERWTEARRRHAASYHLQLARADIVAPSEAPHVRHVYHTYSILCSERQGLRDALDAQAIHTGIHYPLPVHLQPAYSNLGYRRGDFPVTERIADQVLSLPLYPELSESQITSVALAVRTFATRHVGRTS